MGSPPACRKAARRERSDPGVEKMGRVNSVMDQKSVVQLVQQFERAVCAGQGGEQCALLFSSQVARGELSIEYHHGDNAVWQTGKNAGKGPINSLG